MKHLRTTRTPYQEIAVWGNRDEVEFRVTGAIHAWWHRQYFLCGLAWDNMTAGVLSHPGEVRSVLMLGLGGGTSLRTLRHMLPDVSITAVELDDGITSLAREYMDLDKIDIEVISGDAYAWLQASRRKFDVVFDDVYGVTATDVIRPGLYTPALLAALRRNIAPGGIFAVNLVTGAGHRRMQSAFRSFFDEQFPEVRSITTPGSLNECIIGGDSLTPWKDIRAQAVSFPSDRDYTYWRELRCRRRPARTC